MAVATMKSFTYRTSLDFVVGRSGVAHSEGKPELRVGAPPEFKGLPAIWTPEDFFVSAIEVCLMLTFAGIAEKRGLSITAYESTAEGRLEWVDPSYRFTGVIVRPRIVVRDDRAAAVALEVLERAHQTCLVANSVRCAVVVEPEVMTV